MKTESHKLFINGEWVKSSKGEKLKNFNPANKKQCVSVFERGTKEDARKAIDSAEKAFEKWREIPAPHKAKILFRTAQILEERKAGLAKKLVLENGKILKEALGEIQEAIDITVFAAGEGTRMYGETTPSELKNKFCFTRREPIGIVGMITPFNFPIAIPAWKIMPALIAGNTAVIKPAEDTPLMTVLLAEIMQKAGLPKGVLNVVTGPGESVGQEIVNNKKTLAISFTGSREVGQHIMSQAGKQVKKVALELGGKNPMIVLDDADLELAINGLMFGAFATAGQRCTATSRLLLHEKVYAKFLNAFLKKTKKLKLGNGLNPKTEIGPIINEKQLNNIQKYCEIGKKEGAKQLCGGKIAKGGSLSKGWFFEPTIFENVSREMKIFQEEIFGPVLCVSKIKNLKEGVELANATDYGLSASIYSKNINNALKFVEGIESGVCYVNAPTIGAEAHLPFGGVKKSGSGREAGSEAIKEFTELKTVYLDFNEKLQKAQIDEFKIERRNK